MRRPSPAFVLAAVALFVALGGPAEAKKLINGSSIKKGSITARQIKNESLGAADLKPSLIAQLTAVGADAITGTQVKDGSLGAADLAPGTIPSGPGPDSVTSPTVADNSLGAADLGTNAVSSDEIADGTLAGKDLGRFAGTLEDLDFGSVAVGSCKSVTSSSLTPIAGDQSLLDDAIVVNPVAFPQDSFSVYAQPAAANQIAVTVCNVGGPDPVNLGARDFRYVTIDVS